MFAKKKLPRLLLLTALMIAATAAIFLVNAEGEDFKSLVSTEKLPVYILVGILAQLIDGTLGMAYGVSSNTFLLTTGLSPIIASASVHTAEVFTTLVSGISHIKLKNIDKSLFIRLAIPGAIGGAIGAYLLSADSFGDIIKPIISIYLIIMGFYIIIRAFKKRTQYIVNKIKTTILGLVGGFFDAIGGGGWGPIVTTTLVSSGMEPRYVIGTVNSAEFFVTLIQSITFTVIISNIKEYGPAILGLALGGVIAAPIGAILCKKIPAKPMMITVGLLIIFLNIRTLLQIVGVL